MFGVKKGKEIRDDVLERLHGMAASVERMPGRSTNYKVNGKSVVNLRAASRKNADQYWFDVTPELYENNVVDFFLYACGSADDVYIFPTADFKKLIQGASLGGQKQVPNFTLYSDTHEFEPAGMAHSTRRARDYYNQWRVLL